MSQRSEPITAAPRLTTLLALVQGLTRCLESDAEVVAEARRLVNEDRVVLIGNFRGEHLPA